MEIFEFYRNFSRKISKRKCYVNELYVSPLPRWCDSEIAKLRYRSRGKEEFGKGATRWRETRCKETRWREVFRLSLTLRTGADWAPWSS